MRSETILDGAEFPVWFSHSGMITVPYLFGWFLIMIIIIYGSSLFGLLLYILSPAAIILLIGVLITIRFNYADSTNQLNNYYTKFYRLFFSFIPTNPESLDTFCVQPLVWGFLSTFVHLTQNLNLWNGVFPHIGKICGNSFERKRNYLGWIPLIIGGSLLVPIPVLLIVNSVASSYDLTYLRCHLGTDWFGPFVIMSHVFSKFSSPRILVGSYFLGLFLFIFLTQALLLLCTIENIVDYLIAWNEKFENYPKRVFRITAGISILIMTLLGFNLITKAGFYWIRLIDWFIDRLMVVPMIGQAVGLLVVYARARGSRYENPLVKTIIICMYTILFTLTSGAFIWYANAVYNPTPDSQCRTYSKAPINDPLQNRYTYFGWFIASGPLILGLVVGLISTFWNFRSYKMKKYGYCDYLFNGEYGYQRRVHSFYKPSISTRKPPKYHLKENFPLNNLHSEPYIMNSYHPVISKCPSSDQLKSCYPDRSQKCSSMNDSNSNQIWGCQSFVPYNQGSSVCPRRHYEPSNHEYYSNSHNYLKSKHTSSCHSVASIGSCGNEEFL